MNTYNIYDKDNYSTILFHAIAESEDGVTDLAREKSINLTGLTVELERKNVKDQMGNNYSPYISDAVIR